MKLRALQIHQIPGIDAPFSVEPSTEPGVVNLVTGPNAAGKSTVLRAVRGVLYPDRGSDQRWSVVARFELGDERVVDAQNLGGRVHWSVSGDPVTAPALPEPQLADCYLLRFEDLAGWAERSQQALAERVAQELTGGYDLRAVREQFPAKLKPARDGAKALDAARDAYERERQQQVDTHGEGQRLDELREELRAAEAAATEIDRVADAEEYLEARQERQCIDAELAQLPAGVDKLAGNELSQLDQTVKAIEEVRRNRNTAREQQESAEQELANTELQDSDLDKEALQEPREQARAISDWVSRLEKLEEELQGAEAELAQCARTLGRHDTEAPGVTPDQVDAVARLLSEYRVTEAHIEQLREAIDELPRETSRTEPVDALQRARDALRDWLATERALGQGASRWPEWLWLAVPLGLGTLVAAALVHWALVVLLPLAGLGLWARARGRDPIRPLRRARERFEDTGVEAPSSWTDDDVRGLLVELEDAIAEAEQVAERQRLERVLSARREEQSGNEAKLREHGEPLDLDVTRITEGLVVWLNNVEAYRKQSGRVAALRGQRTRCQQSIDEAREAVFSFLRGFNATPSEERPSAAALSAALDRLEQRINARDTAVATRDSAAQQVTQHEATLERLAAQRSALFTDLGLDDRDEDALRACAAQRETYQGLITERQKVQARAESAAARLADERWAELRRLAEADEAQAIAQRHAVVEGQAKQASDLNHEIARINESIRRAREDRRLQKANDELQKARDDLEAVLERGLFDKAGAVLLDDVEERVQEVARPAAFEHAQTWFAAFTNHTYALEVRTTDPPDFVAREAASGVERSLDELSTGTRMQLLLAVRLGFAAYAEGEGARLPVFVDDALATTDPERFGEVAKALQKVAASQDRQVFYLTANPASVQLWRTAIGEEAVHEFDVAAERNIARGLDAPESLLIDAPDRLPGPDEVGTEAFFAQLAVPAPDPWRGPDGVHLFYVLQDRPQWLHRWLDAGIASAGQLQRYLKAQGFDAANDEGDRRLLRARLAAVSAWCAAQREGRGHPIDRTVLATPDSGFAGSTKFEEVVAKCEEKGGDPEALIAALRARELKHLHKPSVDQLESWLAEAGYLPDRDPPSAEQVHERVLATFNGWMDLDEAGPEARALVARLAAGQADA